MSKQTFPLTMTYSLPAVGKGYVAGITIKARLLMIAETGEEVWVYGVNPGGICAFAPTQDAAQTRFIDRFNSVVTDLAESADNFQQFKTELTEAFTTNMEYEKLWLEARKQVQAGSSDIPGMPREVGKIEPAITVEELVLNKTVGASSYNVMKEFKLAGVQAAA